jgi:intracellular sulfur oxidation DsrE/DsrF family protein
VRIILCGQSAAGLGLDETADLLPGVEVALSAMTAHALLQQDGYTVNPF